MEVYNADEIQQLLAMSQGTCNSSTSNDDLTTLTETSESSSEEEEGEADCEDELPPKLPTRMSESDRETDTSKDCHSDCHSDHSVKMNEYPIYEVIK